MRYWKKGNELNNGKYVVEQILGSGGFGVTYRVKQTDKNNKLFALKTLNYQTQNGQSFQQLQVKFINEAIKLAKCSHPYIANVFEVFQEEKLWCMVMEYIEGEDLAVYLRKQGRLSEPEAISIINKVGSALSCVHQQNILHRDIKPENILLRKSDLAPIVIDFGLARELVSNITRQKMTYRGTPFYAPVEQEYELEGEYGAWTDVYALAATLYMLLVGQNKTPGQFSTARKIEYEVNKYDPLLPPKKLNPNISDRINDAILKGMAIEPGDRPRSVKEWLELLREKRRREKKMISKSVSANTSTSVNPKYRKEKFTSSSPHKSNISNTESLSLLLKNYTQAIRLNPNDASAYNNCGTARLNIKDYQGAIADYTQAIRLNPNDASAYNNRGIARLNIKDYQGAITDYTQAIHFNPDFAIAYYNRGIARFNIKDCLGAITDYTQAIRLNPDCKVFYNNRSIARSALGDISGARADRKQANKIKNQN